MAKIKSIHAEEILDSRGVPTIETTVQLADGVVAKSSVPSGQSKGSYEAMELRDANPSRFSGMGVLKAVENVNSVIGPKLGGIDVFQQQKIDRTMIEIDGTANKSRLGANATLSVSQAVAKGGATSSLLPLFIYLREFIPFFTNPGTKETPRSIKFPTPLFNMMEGGAHARSSIDIQECLIVPASSKSYQESLELGASLYQTLKSLLIEGGFSTLVADEGGFAPNIKSNRKALELLKQTERSGFRFSTDFFLGIDAAANTLFKNNMYKFSEKEGVLSTEELADYYISLFSEFSLIYIEDPFSEEDWNGWKRISTELSSKTLIVGDDLVTTNPYRLQLALNNNVINGVIIKPNQIGTVTETIAVCEMARLKNLKIIVSHRAGETPDDFIADFAVAIGADYAKFGAPARERVIKYNRLLTIEKEIQRL